jgi:hypothetical protein
MNANIPVGSTITARYWTIPSNYTVGSNHATKTEALAVAIDELQARVNAHNTRPENKNCPLPERLWVDLRWEVAYPDGGGVDTVAERFEYPDLASARQALDFAKRIEA